MPNNKSLYSIFKNASYRQLSIVAKEVLKWDGDEKNGLFRTTIKEEADFIQFVFSIVYGKHSHIKTSNRIGKTKELNGKTYAIKSILYTVDIGKTTEVSFGGYHSNIEIDNFVCDKMYCFTVPSGMLLLRRNDKIFVTGNCGKDYSKVDRSAAYMARYLAKNIVAANIANTAKVEISYMIGVCEPCSLNIELDTNNDKVEVIKDWIKENVDLTPYGIMKRFYYSYARNEEVQYMGYYGYDVDNNSKLSRLFPWEKLDLVEDLKEKFN